MFLLLAARNAACIPPHGSGGGGPSVARRAEDGGRGASRVDFSATTVTRRVRRPFHHPSLTSSAAGGPPSPLPQGRMTRHRSRDASPCPSFATPLQERPCQNLPPSKQEGGRSAKRRVHPLAASGGAALPPAPRRRGARPPRDALAFRRSTAALAGGSRPVGSTPGHAS